MADGEQERPIPTRQGRSWPAVVGLAAIASLFLGGLVYFGVQWFASQDTHLLATELERGDCVQEPTAEGLEIYPLVACDRPHHGQVIAVLPVPGREFPGTEALRARAERGCGAASERVDAPPRVTVRSVEPSFTIWNLGDRRIVCLAVTTGPALSSSLLD